MSYIENNLNTGEKINHFTKPSIKPTIVLLFILAPMAFLVLLGLSDVVKLLESTIAKVTCLIILIIIYLVVTFIEIYVTEYAITNKRVISKKGLIVRDVAEMNLGSIEGVNLKQGIFGRIFNFGAINISGRGTSNVNFSEIDKPVEIRKKIKHKS